MRDESKEEQVALPIMDKCEVPSRHLRRVQLPRLIHGHRTFQAINNSHSSSRPRSRSSSQLRSICG